MEYKLNDKMSINDTLKHVKTGDIIYLADGIYKEKIQINVNNITIVGQSKENTIITNHDYFHKIMPDYNECNTFRSYTVYVGGDNVKFLNVTIENSSSPSTRYGQAVSLHVDGDRFKCENVYIKSAQDTLFSGPLPDDLIIRHKNFLEKEFLKNHLSRQHYINCDIEGDVDFIFGTGMAFFENCNIIPIIEREDYDRYFIAAPAHGIDQEFGFLFYKCNILKKDNYKHIVSLARPWRDYGIATYIDCNYQDNIKKEGFSDWANLERYKTARFIEYNENINKDERLSWVKQLNKDEKDKYLDEYMKEFNK
ncbi:MAG: hypothetical protein K6E20_03880 [Acholeplasmatales bacterium]|nr:hypothetical protein [Acholeplasmatales bacterium]